MVFQAGQGELTAKINADASGFRSGIQSATAALGGFRGALGIASGAVVAFAGAQGLMSAVQSAAQFEEQMLSLRATVGESEANIRSIRESTMQLAADTGQATSKITDGWRFARSAGLEMSEAQELVETATKASAAGFGEQNELVRTATTAMNTWSSEVESGSEFLDTMTAAAQNADIRVSEMAGAFRRNVNIASQLNLSLEETLGSLSAISGAVGSASRGGRLFQQVLAGLLKPTQQASDVISSAVGSVDNLHQTIREDGLVQALLQLQDNLEANGQGMDDVFRSTRRLEGALALISNEGGRARDIMGQLDNTTGNVDEAFKNTDGTLRNWRQTQQEFNNLIIELGQDALPIANSALSETNELIQTLDVRFARFQEGVDGVSAAFNRLEQSTNINIPDRVWQIMQWASNPTGQLGEAVSSQLPEIPGVNAPLSDPREQQQNMSVYPKEQREKLARSTEKGIEEGQQQASTNTTERKTRNATSRATKSGVESGMSQAEFSDQFASGLRSSIENSVRPTLQQFQDQDAGFLFDPFGDPQEQRRMLQELRSEGEAEFNGLSQDLKRNLQNNLSQAMRDGFSSGEEAARQVLQGIATTLTQRLTQNLADQLFNSLSNINFGGGSGLIGSIGSGLTAAFGDTPGVQEAKDGAVTAFAPGDKFAAAQSMEDLRAQVGAPKQASGPNIQQSTTVQFNVEAVDAESVSRLFQQRSDELAGIITDNIDRRGQVKKAIDGASR